MLIQQRNEYTNVFGAVSSRTVRGVQVARVMALACVGNTITYGYDSEASIIGDETFAASGDGEPFAFVSSRPGNGGTITETLRTVTA